MITIDESKIERDLINALKIHFNNALRGVATDILASIQKMIESLITKSATYKSLESGELMSEFGLANPNIPLKDIVNALKASVRISVIAPTVRQNNVSAGLVIKAVNADLQEVLSLASARYKSNTFTVDWLNWLLLQGDSIIIANANVERSLTPEEKKRSRTGVALMEHGSGWKVPSSFSGIISDNWITKTLNDPSIENQLNIIIKKSIESRF